jgi:hypothetical protein
MPPSGTLSVTFTFLKGTISMQSKGNLKIKLQKGKKGFECQDLHVYGSWEFRYWRL